MNSAGKLFIQEDVDMFADKTLTTTTKFAKYVVVFINGICIVLPVNVDKLNSLFQKRRRPIKNPRSIDITETDDETDEDDEDEDENEDPSKYKFKAKPYPYFVFDINAPKMKKFNQAVSSISPY